MKATAIATVRKSFATGIRMKASCLCDHGQWSLFGSGDLKVIEVGGRQIIGQLDVVRRLPRPRKDTSQDHLSRSPSVSG